jgi:hypothetical protein
MTVTLWPKARQVAWDNSVYCIGSYRLEETNDVFNGMEAITSCHPATLLACVARHWVVGSLSIVPHCSDPP